MFVKNRVLAGEGSVKLFGGGAATSAANIFLRKLVESAAMPPEVRF